MAGLHRVPSTQGELSSADHIPDCLAVTDADQHWRCTSIAVRYRSRHAQRQCHTGRPGKRPAIADIPGTTMTLTPEYGEEERMRQQSEGLRQRSEGVLPQDREDAPEREIEEHDREDRELAYLDPEDNEARAPGQVCERCGAVITESQDARLRPDGRWVHEVCPRVPGELPAQSTGPLGGA